MFKLFILFSINYYCLANINVPKIPIKCRNAETITSIPQLGFGTYSINDSKIIINAIENGYRHIDTAYIYGNEKAIGQALKQVFISNKLKREDLFITTKIWSNFHSKEKAIENHKTELKDLGTNYSDLALVHYPFNVKDGDNPEPKYPNGSLIPKTWDKDVHYLKAYEGLEEAQRQGLVKAIGVSNFNIEQLRNLIENSYVKPSVLQVENNPLFNQEQLVQFCEANDILVISSTPMRLATKEILNDKTLLSIGKKYNKTPLQVALRWNLQRGLVVIPRSKNDSHQKQNINVFDFKLSEEDILRINNIKQFPRLVNVNGSQSLPDYSFNVDYKVSPRVVLNDGYTLPVMGFGAFQIFSPNIISQAIRNGYRLIDTAYIYGTEKVVGQAINKEIERKLVKRQDLYIVTKIWTNFMSRSGAVENTKSELKTLQTNYSDLAFLHYPFNLRAGSDPRPVFPNGTLIPIDWQKDVHYIEAYKGLEDAKRQGLVRSIGVSNFNIDQMKILLSKAEIKPAVLQIENNPLYQQNELVEYCKSNDILVMAYSPTRKNSKEIFNEPILKEIAKKHNKTVPQVALRWNIQRGIPVIPRSQSSDRQIENFNAIDFELTIEDMAKISTIKKRPKIIDVKGSEGLPDYSFKNETIEIDMT